MYALWYFLCSFFYLVIFFYLKTYFCLIHSEGNANFNYIALYFREHFAR